MLYIALFSFTLDIFILSLCKFDILSYRKPIEVHLRSKANPSNKFNRRHAINLISLYKTNLHIDRLKVIVYKHIIINLSFYHSP